MEERTLTNTHFVSQTTESGIIRYAKVNKLASASLAHVMRFCGYPQPEDFLSN